MRVVRGLDRARGLFPGSVVTIGNFDGVHHGHQVILRQLVDDARAMSAAAVVLTFDPHPVSVLRPDAAPRLLMPLGDRLATLAEHGPDVTVVQRFSLEFAAVEAEDFVRRFLVEILETRKLVVGHDLNFGRGRKGSVESVIEAGGRYGFDVDVIRPVDVEGLVVHSSAVRKAVSEGNVALARQLLGRPHRVRGRVGRGAGRGTGLGFATANLIPRTEALPPEGVYATVGIVDGRPIDGVTSIGHTPTFGGDKTVIEAHLFADVGDLYGKNLSLHFYEHIRGQKKFDGPQALVAQIKHDVNAAKEILAREAR